MLAFQYRPYVLILGLVATLGLSFAEVSYNLSQSKIFFLIMTGLLVFFISIRSNHYTINSHSLLALGFVWFIWFPLFDILFLHQYIPYWGLWETRIDLLSQRDDIFFTQIILTSSVFLISYISTVSLIASSSRQAKPYFIKHNPQIHVDSSLLWLSVVTLLVIYLILIAHNLTTPKDFSHWTEERSYGGGGVGFFLSNANFFLTSIIYFLIIYTYKNPKIGRNVRILVQILLLEVAIFYFLDNSRIFLLSFLVGLAAVFERLGKEIKWYRIFFFSVFFFSFMVFVSLRRSYLDLDFLQLLSQISVFSDLSFVNVARKELEWYPGLGYWLELYDSNSFSDFPYSRLGYVFKIFFFWVPGDLFDFQEGPFTAFLGYYLTGDPLFSCNITALGELSLMFGWSGVIGFGVVAGVMSYLLDIRQLQTHLNFPFLIFVVIILQIFRGPFYYFSTQMILLTLVWGLIFTVILKKGTSFARVDDAGLSKVP